MTNANLLNCILEALVSNENELSFASGYHAISILSPQGLHSACHVVHADINALV